MTFSLAGGLTASTTSSVSGDWLISKASIQGAVDATVSAQGYLTRQLHLSSPSVPRDVAIDLIKDAAPFSLSYYRQLVRNELEEPETYQPVRRWKNNPNFHINLRNPLTGEEIAAAERDKVIATIRAAVPQMTGGQFEAGAIEVRLEDRLERLGVINVVFVHEPDSDYCGRAFVGADPGRITLSYSSQRCAPWCGNFTARTVAHEVGPAMGFWHVAEGAVLNKVWSERDCGTTTFSAAERYHAKVAYSRPPGNAGHRRRSLVCLPRPSGKHRAAHRVLPVGRQLPTPYHPLSRLYPSASNETGCTTRTSAADSFNPRAICR